MPRHRPRILVVDRESEAARQLVAFLHEHDFDVTWMLDAESAHNAITDTSPDCLVCEIRTRHIDGLGVLARAKERNPELCAVMITEGADVAVAVEAMRRGAYDFQAKPLNRDKLLATLRLGLQHQRLAARVARMQDALDTRFGLESLTGNSRAIQRVRDQIRRIAPTRATVLIEGEHGAGKGVVARAIHQNSTRRLGPFVAVSCTGPSTEFLEQELFGLARGSTVRRQGRIEQAEGGTLFLDDIGDASPSVQLRMLRMLQDRAFDRVGGTQSAKVDVRLVVASSRDLGEDVRHQRFREDLFHTLSVVRILVPALRERHEDIALLVEAFLRPLGRAHGRRITAVTPGVLERFVAYAWPENVRELKNTLAGMIALSQSNRPLEVSALPQAIRGAEVVGARAEFSPGMTMAEAERRLIELTLKHTRGDKARAARMLGIGLRTLYRKLHGYSGN
ncbi:MAG: sigma-54 dependent transcriptional regulator [Candidatus Eisenbacteria bacterium]